MPSKSGAVAEFQKAIENVVNGEADTKLYDKTLFIGRLAIVGDLTYMKLEAGDTDLDAFGLEEKRWAVARDKQLIHRRTSSVAFVSLATQPEKIFRLWKIGSSFGTGSTGIITGRTFTSQRDLLSVATWVRFPQMNEHKFNSLVQLTVEEEVTIIDALAINPARANDMKSSLAKINELKNNSTSKPPYHRPQ